MCPSARAASFLRLDTKEGCLEYEACEPKAFCLDTSIINGGSNARELGLVADDLKCLFRKA